MANLTAKEIETSNRETIEISISRRNVKHQLPERRRRGDDRETDNEEEAIVIQYAEHIITVIENIYFETLI